MWSKLAYLWKCHILPKIKHLLIYLLPIMVLCKFKLSIKYFNFHFPRRHLVRAENSLVTSFSAVLRPPCYTAILNKHSS